MIMQMILEKEERGQSLVDEFDKLAESIRGIVESSI